MRRGSSPTVRACQYRGLPVLTSPETELVRVYRRAACTFVP